MGIEARFVGGCVRDAFMGKITDDFDIAFSGDSSKLIRFLKNRKIQCIRFSERYNTFIVLINDKKFELTALRRDTRCYGRECDIEKVSSFEEDAKRRDFTINSIYVAFDGTVFDPFNGITDLQNKNIKFIGNPEERIEEDALRILRYYRFTSYINSVDTTYHEILQKKSYLIKKLPIERIQKEIFKIIDAPFGCSGLRAMEKDMILKNITDYWDIKAFEKLGSIKQKVSIPVRLFCLFQNKVFDYFVLTKGLKKTIKRVMVHLNDDERFIWYKFGKEFIDAVRQVKFALFDEKISSDYPVFASDKFPLHFDDIEPKSALVFKNCERWWAINNGKPTKKECLEFCKLFCPMVLRPDKKS